MNTYNVFTHCILLIFPAKLYSILVLQDTNDIQISLQAYRQSRMLGKIMLFLGFIIRGSHIVKNIHRIHILFHNFLFCFHFNRYPWGQEAFDKAKCEDKPIFLSGNIMLYLTKYRMNSYCFIPQFYYCL